MENTWSIGKSTKPTPDGAPTAARKASSTSRPASSADCAVAAKRASGATNGTWSISCSEPMAHRCAGARPPSTTSGEEFCCAAAIALIPLVTPGPAVSAATPGSRVTFDQPSAANVAVCSCRVSISRMPSSRQPS
ncbi:hypothetical protein MOKP118_07300 [Mycobacterium avium subsp. hominissuis]